MGNDNVILRLQRTNEEKPLFVTWLHPADAEFMIGWCRMREKDRVACVKCVECETIFHVSNPQAPDQSGKCKMCRTAPAKISGRVWK